MERVTANLASIRANPAYQQQSDSDWHVLVLFEDTSETDIKGIWGPYTSERIAHLALDELRQWPLDGVWDVRRLNKFVAAKAGNPADGLMRWSWQTHG